MSTENPYERSQVETATENTNSKLRKLFSSPLAIRSIIAGVIFFLLVAAVLSQIVIAHEDASNPLQSVIAREEVMFFALLMALPSIVAIICSIPCLIWGNRYVLLFVAFFSLIGLYRIIQLPEEIGPQVTIEIGYYFWFASVAMIFFTSCVLTYQGFHRKPEF